MEKIIQFPKYSDIYAKDTINLYMKLSKINKLRNRQKSRNNHKKRKFQKNSEIIQKNYIIDLSIAYMGVLERENNIAYDEETSKPIDIANSNTSPMAITNRVLISSLLGGYNDFNSQLIK